MVYFYVAVVLTWVTRAVAVATSNSLLRRDSGHEVSHQIEAASEGWAWGRDAPNTPENLSTADSLTETSMVIDATHEKKFQSQNGEDGILTHLCDIVGCRLKTYVEFGAHDSKCLECNTLHLRKLGWKGLAMGDEENLDLNLRKEYVSAYNVVSLLQKYGVPQDFDVLSVDVDGADFFHLRSLFCSHQFRPKIIVAEYNAHIPASAGALVTPLTVPPSDCTGYCNGMSLGALKALGAKFGYALVYAMSCGVNAFLVRREVLPSSFQEPAMSSLDRPLAYKEKGPHGWQKAQPRWENLGESALLKTCEDPKAGDLRGVADLMNPLKENTQSQTDWSQSPLRDKAAMTGASDFRSGPERPMEEKTRHESPGKEKTQGAMDWSQSPLKDAAALTGSSDFSSGFERPLKEKTYGVMNGGFESAMEDKPRPASPLKEKTQGVVDGGFEHPMKEQRLENPMREKTQAEMDWIQRPPKDKAATTGSDVRGGFGSPVNGKTPAQLVMSQAVMSPTVTSVYTDGKLDQTFFLQNNSQGDRQSNEVEQTSMRNTTSKTMLEQGLEKLAQLITGR
jgi:hypothetical protein